MRWGGSGSGNDPSLLCSPDVRLCAGLPSTGLWDSPRLVKPTDSTRRTAVHRSSALPLTAQMWDKQIPLFVYTWSLYMCCACLLAFCVRVVFWWSPMTPHCSLWSSFLEVFCIWQLMALLRCCGCTPQWAFLRDGHIFGLLVSKTAPDVYVCNSSTWNWLLLIAALLCVWVTLVHSVLKQCMRSMIRKLLCLLNLDLLSLIITDTPVPCLWVTAAVSEIHS